MHGLKLRGGVLLRAGKRRPTTTAESLRCQEQGGQEHCSKFILQQFRRSKLYQRSYVLVTGVECMQLCPANKQTSEER